MRRLKQSSKRQSQEEEPPEEPSGPSASSLGAKSSLMDLREPPEHKSSRHLSPAERADSKEKRQRRAEVNGVLTITGGSNGSKIAAWTEEQQAKHEATLEELRNMEIVEWWKWAIDCELDACRNNDWTVHTRSELWQEVLNKWSVRTQILYAGIPKLTTLRGFFTLAAIHCDPVAFGDCHSASHITKPTHPIELNAIMSSCG